MFNLREFQTETQYNEVKNDMPTPNVVHIIEPDMMKYNTHNIDKYWWKTSVKDSRFKIRGLGIYDNAYGKDSPYSCEIKFNVYLINNNYYNFMFSLKYEKYGDYYPKLWIGNSSPISHNVLINNGLATYNSTEHWYSIPDLNKFFTWLKSNGYVNFGNNDIDYMKYNSFQGNVSTSHLRYLIKEGEFEDFYTITSNDIQYIPNT